LPINIKIDNENEENQSVTIGTKRHVASLKKIVQIATGNDHFVALNNEGEVLTMGDDTYGFFLKISLF
jgi:alpha-tubulin suppressor-like RCC1 family protein